MLQIALDPLPLRWSQLTFAIRAIDEDILAWCTHQLIRRLQFAQVLLKTGLAGLAACSCGTACCTCSQAATMNVQFVRVHAILTSTDHMSNLLRQAFERLTRSAAAEGEGWFSAQRLTA
ncbi:hypothetical protein [Mesorhizobium sp.]|uniref:hypothetical protein n=1 Tax=Mesorhizobium sp. TaxID=1871066 RepID=UPI0025BEC33D|nr:hypothetical protein [Mesorhizobium sp.]